MAVGVPGYILMMILYTKISWYKLILWQEDDQLRVVGFGNLKTDEFRQWFS